jgi:hypothetical protein
MRRTCRNISLYLFGTNQLILEIRGIVEVLKFKTEEEEEKCMLEERKRIISGEASSLQGGIFDFETSEPRLHILDRYDFCPF